MIQDATFFSAGDYEKTCWEAPYIIYALISGIAAWEKSVQDIFNTASSLNC